MKNNTLWKKLGLTTALAATFGLVSSGVFLSVNGIAQSTAAQQTAIEATAQAGSAAAGEDTKNMLYNEANSVDPTQTDTGEIESTKEANVADANASGGTMTVAEVAANSMPAMVAITNTSVEDVQSYFGGSYGDFSSIFGDEFGDIFGNGNGQESTSEAMQGWGGMYLLALALGDDAMRDAAIFGYVSEARGTAEYWFDRDRENIDYTKYKHPYNSNLTCHGVGWWTWFSGDPVWMHSIQWLPNTPALDYLSEATRALLDERPARINAADKDVVVIGGGDTGVDCVATALRQGARSVRQVIRAAEPPVSVDSAAVWPAPRGERTTGYGQREAAVVFGSDPRIWSTDTVGFADDGAGHVRGVVVESGSHGSEHAHSEVPAQLVLIAKGFTGAERSVLDAFEGFGNVHIAGDARMGASLVASAIADGLQVAGKLASELFG